MSQAKIKVKKQSRALWPIMGLVLAVALAAIAWVLKDPVKSILPDQVDRMLTRLPGIQGELAVAAMLFVVMLSVIAIIVAVAAPKSRLNVKTKDILKERNQMVASREAMARRQQRVARENRRQSREDAKRRSGYEE
jgi:multidrug efflux pump subunit AcrA (membrane-fusion protein)